MIPLPSGDSFSNPYHASARVVAIVGRADPKQVLATFFRHDRSDLFPRRFPGLPRPRGSFPFVGGILRRTVENFLPCEVAGLERCAQVVLMNFVFEANSIDPDNPRAHQYTESALLLGATTSTRPAVISPNLFDAMAELSGTGRKCPHEKTGFFVRDVVVDKDPMALRMGNCMGFDKQTGVIRISTSQAGGPHVKVDDNDGMAFEFDSGRPTLFTRRMPSQVTFQMTTAAPIWCNSTMFSSGAFMTLTDPHQTRFRVGQGRMGMELSRLGFAPFAYMAGTVDSVSMIPPEELLTLRAWMR